MFNPKENFLMKTFSLLNEFGSVNRYSKNRPLKEENNIDHTGWVCLFSYIIACDIQRELEIDLDFGLILKGAVCHDLDEALTGDIPRPTKYFNEEINSAIKDIESNSVEYIMKALNQKSFHKDNLQKNWSEAKGFNFPEQYIVKMADVISVVYKCWHEVILLNNYSFMVVVDEIIPVVEGYHQYNYTKTKVPEVELYFKEVMKDCSFILNQCKNTSKHRSIVMPTFIKFP